jgi:hypothetical protein
MLDFQPRLSNTAHLALKGGRTAQFGFPQRMPTELIRLENFSFAAWGCSACAWIVPSPSLKIPGKAPAKVKEAFEKHECANFPSHTRRVSKP